MRKYLNLKFLLAFGFALLWILPIIFMITTSFEQEIAAIQWPITLIPSEFSVDAYSEIFSNPQVPIMTWYFNSLTVATIHTILALVFFSMAGFAFAKLNFTGRDRIFQVLMFTMMIPAITNLVPLYFVVDTMGLVGTKLALILPSLSSVFSVFLMRQFMISVPDELIEAAHIDGASYFYIYRKIMLPIVRPGLVVVGLNAFLGSWNEFLWASTVTNSVSEYTLPVGLAIVKGSYGGQFAILLALVVVSVLPAFIIYIAFQKYIIDGVDISSGIK